jgi:ribosomal protein S18 acetylase RimI-like enzyme
MHNQPENIQIIEINPENLKDVNQIDGRFLIQSKLLLNPTGDQIDLVEVPIPPYEKRYPLDELSPQEILASEKNTVFLAYQENQVCGQINLVINWNKYGYIDKLVVDRKFRKRGIATALIENAESWAKENDLPGLMLETQNNNVNACKLYTRLGFELCGFDTQVYKAMLPDTDEIALYFYKVWEPCA